MKILQVAHHRNGICGIDFHAVLFQDSPDGKTENFLATVFPEKGAVAVVGLDRIEQDGVAFGANSWRGDRYEADLFIVKPDSGEVLHEAWFDPYSVQK